MTPLRYKQLELDLSLKLTPEEVEEGWHFCQDWDYMLINQDWPQAESCLCERWG